jgi:cation transporter-like permease
MPASAGGLWGRPTGSRHSSVVHQETLTPRYTLEAIIVVLLLLWLLGAFVFPFGGSLIHLFLVVILIVVLLRLLQGRRPLP